MISQNLKEFIAFFPKGLVKRLNSLVLVNERIDSKSIIAELYDEIVARSYNPSKCIGYLAMNKHNNVPRIVPVLSAKDYFLYYFCVKILEKELVQGRVEGTYGAWSMGNEIRKMEDRESLLLEGYGSLDSLNPYKWVKYWKDFQKKAYDFAQLSERKCIIKLDVANFYNSINLQKLKEKIILRISEKKKPVLDLLFSFLERWDRGFMGYSPRSIGLPMDKIGDCSRILANFYLQDFDRGMLKLCDSFGAKFLRYADDILIYCKNQRISKKILFECSHYLRELDLDINTGKVVTFTSKKQFNDYWGFDFYEEIGDGKDPESLERAVKKLVRYRRDGVKFRESSVVRRLLNCRFEELSPEVLEVFLRFVLRDEFLELLDYRTLESIFRRLDPLKQQKMIKKLYHLIRRTNFNYCLYNIRKFLERNAEYFDFSYIDRKLDSLKIR